MSIITILPSGHNVIVSNSGLDNGITVTQTGLSISTVTINQGQQGPAGVSVIVSNYGNNRIPTSDGTFGGLYAESNLTFDGSKLRVSGIEVSLSGHSHLASNILDLNEAINNTIQLSHNGRLTLESNNATHMPDATGSVVYFTPYLGNSVSLYNISSNSWVSYKFNEISLSLSNMTTNTNYDIFLYYNGSNLILENEIWSNDSTRSIDLTYQDGVLVKNNSINKRYIGTIRSTSSNTTEDSSKKRFIYNVNNQIQKSLLAEDNIAHTYTSSTIRPYRNITTLGNTKVEFVSGIGSSMIPIFCNANFVVESSSSSVGLGLDTISSINTKAMNIQSHSSGPALFLNDNTPDIVVISSGYHYLQLLQYGSTTTTFYNSSFKAIVLC